MSFEIIDNFLEKSFFDLISKDIKSSKIPWYFREVDVRPKEKNNLSITRNKNGYFSFCYFENNTTDSPLFYKHIVPVLVKLNAISLVHIRALLFFRDKDTIESAFHTDFNLPNIKTAILYLNDCNGGTVVKQNEKEVFVKSVSNRVLIMDENIEHKGVYQTDTHKRYLLNFNYFTK